MISKSIYPSIHSLGCNNKVEQWRPSSSISSLQHHPHQPTLSSQNLQEQDTTISSQGSHLPVQDVSESLHPFTTAVAVMVAAPVVQKLTVTACRCHWHRTPRDCDFERGREGGRNCRERRAVMGMVDGSQRLKLVLNLLLLRRSGRI